MKDSSESLIGEELVIFCKSCDSRFRWNTAREGVEGHQVSCNTAREGVEWHRREHWSVRRTAGSLCLRGLRGRGWLTHLLTRPWFPSRPGESKWLGILVLRAQRLGECVSCHAAAANRGLSLREGVLAKASAVRPRATPRPCKKDTHTPHGQQADTPRTLHGVPRNRTSSFIHSYIHTFIHSYIHTFIHSYSAEQAERRTAEHSE